MIPGRFALLLLAAVAYPAAAASAATHYVVAFNQPNGLPKNVDKLIADAGGTIVERQAFYSSYGMGKTDVSAPGGSTRDYNGVPGGATCDGHGASAA